MTCPEPIQSSCAFVNSVMKVVSSSFLSSSQLFKDQAQLSLVSNLPETFTFVYLGLPCDEFRSSLPGLQCRG